MDIEALKKKFVQVDPWWVFAGVLLVVLILVVWYYGYMLMEVKNVKEEKAIAEEVLWELKSELREAQKDEWYKKYQSAKKVFISAENLDWTERTDYLIDLLNNVIAIDQQDQRASFEEFQVWTSSIGLQWNVMSITNMYREWWVIDSITAFDFVENVSIPFYKTNEEWVEFILNADIQEYAK